MQTRDLDRREGKRHARAASAWSTDDVAEWLCGVMQLPMYEAGFRRNSIDGAVLLELEKEELQHLGVLNAMHRSRIAAETKKLRMQQEPATANAAFDESPPVRSSVQPAEPDSLNVTRPEQSSDDRAQMIRKIHQSRRTRSANTPAGAEPHMQDSGGSALGTWSVSEVVEWLCKTVQLPRYATHFSEHDVDGRRLSQLNDAALSELGMVSSLHRVMVLSKANQLKEELDLADAAQRANSWSVATTDDLEHDLEQ